MEPFQLIRNKHDFKEQLDFLISLEFRRLFMKYRVNGIYLIGLTILALLLALLSDDTNYLALKVVSTVMLALLWILALVFLLSVIIKFLNRKKWKFKEISKYVAHESIEFFFDNEIISYKSEKYNTSLKWDYFKYFRQHKNSIFIFNDVNTYQALYFSSTELGEETFQILKVLVSEKLVPLP